MREPRDCTHTAVRRRIDSSHTLRLPFRYPFLFATDDFYTPTRPYIGTYYGNEKGNADQAFHATSKETQTAQKRMATLLKWPGSDQSPAALAALGDKFGLGKRRTLEQYAKASGVDSMTQKLTKSCMVQYTPWDPSMKNTVYMEVCGAECSCSAISISMPILSVQYQGRVKKQAAAASGDGEGDDGEGFKHLRARRLKALERLRRKAF